MTAFIMTAIIVFYGIQGQPVNATTVITEYSSSSACEKAREKLTKAMQEGSVTSICSEK